MIQSELQEPTFKVQIMKLVDYKNSIDPDEAVHYELPHQDLHCLPFFFSKFSI